jgi:Ser/Thr protein kinase RdoA (MazF antagonist)
MGDQSERTISLIAEIAHSYEFRTVEDWRWLKEGESPAVAEIRADGRGYVARTFTDETEAHRADDVAGLHLHLASAGVEAEEVVPDASGEPVCRLPSGVSIILSPFYPDSPVPLPFDEETARAWGRYVASMHAACRGWRPTFGLPSPWLRHDPVTVLGRALSITESSPTADGVLKGASERIIRCWDGGPPIHAVHGDLWPGNLLKGPSGLRAIDFAEAGEGPSVIDLATAFRWMPWREDREGASRLWAAWLAGYTEGGELPDAELAAMSAVAGLQHVVWMITEVGSSQDTATVAWYVEDHCSAIQALLTADGT